MNNLSSAVSVSESSSSEARLSRTGIIIPTRNASRYWASLHHALLSQGISDEQVLIIDSSSSDNTGALVQQAGYRLVVIPRESFCHGATRQLASRQMPWAQMLLYLTQDAVPAEKNSIEKLLHAFEDPDVGAAYGRQLPRDGADAIERHARLFNYPDVSDVRNFESRKVLGFKAAFFSNSFAAYRHDALKEVGGFPKETIVSEEVTVAGRMLMAGWKVAYVADSTVIHSHPLTVGEEFRRYFDIAVHHAREHWLLDTFGKVGAEGRSFAVSQFHYLFQNEPGLIPLALLRNAGKWAAYQIGLRERFLPLAVKRSLSHQPHFWRDTRRLNAKERVPKLTPGKDSLTTL